MITISHNDLKSSFCAIRFDLSSSSWTSGSSTSESVDASTSSGEKLSLYLSGSMVCSLPSI